jgi:hypothetical protein
MSALREKIIRALLENAYIALFEFYRYCSNIAACESAKAEEAAALVAIGNDYEGNGTRKSAIEEWLLGYRSNKITEYKKRGND